MLRRKIFSLKCRLNRDFPSKNEKTKELHQKSTALYPLKRYPGFFRVIYCELAGIIYLLEKPGLRSRSQQLAYRLVVYISRSIERTARLAVTSLWIWKYLTIIT